ncbi:MAG: hypothetical protein KAR40_11350 [Candidatus Sabulitectum sp.]|nr:hypothetical protein [Candidatus Sabulitectum sp.]
MSSNITFQENRPFGEVVLIKDLPPEYDCVQLYGHKNSVGREMKPIGSIKLRHQIYIHDLEKLYADGWREFTIYPMNAQLRGRIPNAMFKADDNG